jgi:hypothetical protein
MREFHPNDSTRLEQLTDSEIECLRCQIRMKDAGRMTIHHGPVTDNLGEMAGAPARRSVLDLRICQKCGKVEMYV